MTDNIDRWGRRYNSNSTTVQPSVAPAAAADAAASSNIRRKVKRKREQQRQQQHKRDGQQRRQHHRHYCHYCHYHHPSLLFCATLFVVIYVQITTNFFYVYHYHYQYHSHNQNQNKNHATDTAVSGSSSSSRRNSFPNDPDRQGDGDGDEHQELTQEQQQLINGLRSRLRRLEGEAAKGDGRHGRSRAGDGDVYHDTLRPLPLPPFYEDDGNFVAFTIRDARRTVPTNVIPDGFHIFDILDLEGGNVEADEEVEIEERDEEIGHGSKNRHPHGGRRTNSTVVAEAVSSTDRKKKKKKVKVTDQVSTTRATTFHNGYALPASFQARCQTYSLKCYRMKIAAVFEYLLKTKNRPTSSTPNNQHVKKTSLRMPGTIQDSVTQNTTYFFYMEPDNNLCVPLTEIRRLAYKYRRYFISTGVGFSGYIMSRTFVEDFVKRYEGQQSLENRKKRYTRHVNVPWLRKQPHQNDTTSLPNSSDEEDDEVVELHPEVVAGQILREKQAWSVTRRYLTSHTVLGNSPGLGGEGMASLTDLFGTYGQHHSGSSSTTQVDSEDGTTHHDNEEKEVVEEEDESNESSKDTGTASNSTNPTQSEEDDSEESDNVIPRHLPRCLEPHRGIWWKVDVDEGTGNTTNSSALRPEHRTEHTDKDAVQNDIEQWNFFAYDLCPDSEVFPCKEGQLSQLYSEGNEGGRSQ